MPESDYLITHAQLSTLKRVASRLYTENRLNGDEMRDLGHALTAVHDTCIQLEIPSETLKTDLIEQARADGVIEAYAALVGLRTRYSMTEMADALERACTALSVDLTLVRDRIPPG